jgi:integrase
MAQQRKRNPNGAGTITKRKDGRFQCAVYVLQPDGTRARKFAYGRTWAECDAKRRELLDKVDQGVPVPTKSAKLSEWLPYWLDNVIKPRRKLSTFDKYEAHVRLYLVPLLGPKRLESLGVADVRRFLVRLEKQTTAATAKESHRVLRSALSSACREELITRNVAKLVEPPRTDTPELRPWTLDETLDFLAASRKDPLYAAFVLAIAMGLRRGEIVGLRWSDVDLDNRVLYVRHQVQRRRGSCTTTTRRAAVAALSRCPLSVLRPCAGSACGRRLPAPRRGRSGRTPTTSSPPGQAARSSRATSTAPSPASPSPPASASSGCTTPGTARPPFSRLPESRPAS